MYEKVFKISMIMVTAAILTMPSLVLQLSHAQTNADFKDTILNIHNKERAEVGVPQLTWSSNLAADALNYAKHLTTLGLGPDDTVPHDQNTDEGENLAWGTKAGFSTAEHVNGWVSEKSNYDGSPIRDFSEEGPVTGHYTQMVWKDTTQIGCGIASDAGQDYLVCRYSPSGNIIGETPYGQGEGAQSDDQGAGAQSDDQGAGAQSDEEDGDGDGGDNNGDGDGAN